MNITVEKKKKNSLGNRSPLQYNRIKKTWNTFRNSTAATVLFTALIPAITTLTLEWIARGNFAPNKQHNGFFQAMARHPASFFISYLLLVCLYVFISQLTGLHALATGMVGLVGNLPAVVTYYKLTMRGEPFLPWDLSQIGDLVAMEDHVGFSIQPNMIITLVLFALLILLAAFVKIPSRKADKLNVVYRLITSGVSLVVGLVLLFGIFLSPSGTKGVGIQEDHWMQDRYYRTNGVLTGFLTNLQLLNIAMPPSYSEESVLAIAEQTQALAGSAPIPFYPASYAAVAQELVEHPDIIFVMGESFWDVTQLKGIEYDREILPNLTRLRQQAASGMVYSPSFGGGTCDVEFEALTGFSVENLPSGSKPFQQYINDETFALPQYLKSKGYETLAIHGYGRRFWNRDTAYPRLGIDTFIAQDDFINPEKRRGFISDRAMVDRIMEEYEARTADGTSVFIHAVTMQNHTTYSRNRYPKNELVKVMNAPPNMPDSTIGQLEDCATGIFEMDAAIGRLTDHLRGIGRPAIVVFWGDHLNPMSDGYTMFEQTGMIEKGDTSAAVLRKTPLLIWSNYAENEVNLGTIAAYNLSPVMMDLYGLQKPLMFDYLMQQLPVYHARSHGITIGQDNTDSPVLTDEQQDWFNKHAVLQYDFLFGKHVLENYAPKE